ncbi:MAG: hypothetical protein IPK33_33190 [Gemmatimonadetes bacterium]|nr:hypothetical protein [Gemmatimonadota bacterium]
MPTSRSRSIRPGISFRPSRPAAALALALGAALSTGCYSYQPVTLSELKPEMPVRVQLTAVAVDRLRNGGTTRRASRDFSLSGNVARVNADSVVLSVQTSRTTDATVRPVAFTSRSAAAERAAPPRFAVSTVGAPRGRRRVLSTLAIGAAVYAIKHGGEASGSTPVPGRA